MTSGLDCTVLEECLRLMRTAYLQRNKHDGLEGMFPCRQKIMKCAVDSKSLPPEQKFTHCLGLRSRNYLKKIVEVFFHRKAKCHFKLVFYERWPILFQWYRSTSKTFFFHSPTAYVLQDQSVSSDPFKILKMEEPLSKIVFGRFILLWVVAKRSEGMMT